MTQLLMIMSTDASGTPAAFKSSMVPFSNRMFAFAYPSVFVQYSSTYFLATSNCPSVMSTPNTLPFSPTSFAAT